MQVRALCVSPFEKQVMNNDKSFCHCLPPRYAAFTVRAWPATWIQYHWRHALIPLRCVPLFLGSVHKQRDDRHSSHCLISWNEGSLRHHSVFGPEAFLGLLSATVFSEHRVLVCYETTLSTSAVYYITNSSMPEAKPGVFSSTTAAATGVYPPGIHSSIHCLVYKSSGKKNSGKGFSQPQFPEKPRCHLKIQSNPQISSSLSCKTKKSSKSSHLRSWEWRLSPYQCLYHTWVPVTEPKYCFYELKPFFHFTKEAKHIRNVVKSSSSTRVFSEEN